MKSTPRSPGSNATQFFGGRFRLITSIVFTPPKRTLTKDTNSSHCSTKSFEVLSELFYYALRTKVVFCATSSSENAPRCCLVAILRPSRCHTRPSRGPLAALPEVALDRKKQCKSAPFSSQYFEVCQSRPDDRFLQKGIFCTTSSIQSHSHGRIAATWVSARTI